MLKVSKKYNKTTTVTTKLKSRRNEQNDPLPMHLEWCNGKNLSRYIKTKKKRKI